MVTPPSGSYQVNATGDTVSHPFLISDPVQVYEVLLASASTQVALFGAPAASAPGAQVGRTKLTQNGGPIPHDRVFVDYSYFDNTPLYAGGVNVNRVVPGFEKTFLGGWMSFELRGRSSQTSKDDNNLS